MTNRGAHLRFIAVLLMALLGTGATAARGQTREHAGHDSGTVDFPISCSEEAQVDFNRAIALLHHMTYPRAREAFEQVARTDPRCAMAHWGIAMHPVPAAVACRSLRSWTHDPQCILSPAR
jgi:hypothetical protein